MCVLGFERPLFGCTSRQAVHAPRHCTFDSNVVLILQAFTGKPARGLQNTPSRLLQEVQSQLPTTAYGLVNSRGFYRAAAEAGVKDCVLQLCGQGYPLIRTGPAADIMSQILAQADEAAQRLCAGGS